MICDPQKDPGAGRPSNGDSERNLFEARFAQALASIAASSRNGDPADSLRRIQALEKLAGLDSETLTNFANFVTHTGLDTRSS